MNVDNTPSFLVTPTGGSSTGGGPYRGPIEGIYFDLVGTLFRHC
jgi:hypothetical protein